MTDLGYSSVNAVERAMAMLDILAARPEGVSVGELANQLGISRSIASRILASLKRTGYAVQDPASQRYRLALKLVALGLSYMDSVGLAELCRPILQKLAQQTGELVQLAVVEGSELLFIAKVAGQHPLRVASMLGRRAVLHAMSSGKAWLAFLPEEEAVRLVAARGLPRLTPRTITTLEGLREEWARVRSQGYAVAIEEIVEGVYSLAAPILARGRVVAGTVSVALPVSRAGNRFPKDLAALAIAASRELSEVWPTD